MLDTLKELMMIDSNSYINVRDYGAKASDFSTRVRSNAGCDLYLTEDTGDIRVGDEMLLTGACPSVVGAQLYVRRDVSSINPRPPKRRFTITDEMELVGYDGSDGDKVVYIIDICPELPGIIRWSRDFGTSWIDNVEIRNGECTLDHGRRLIIRDFEDLAYGCTAVFVCSAQTVCQVVSVQKNGVRLSATATVSADCTLSYSDSAAINNAVCAAISEEKGVYFPGGRYNLTDSVRIKSARNISIIGESSASVILDYSLGDAGDTVDIKAGHCFKVESCENVLLRGFTMVGNSSFKERAREGCIKTRGVEPTKVYGFYYRLTAALQVTNVSKMRVEDCHARGMSGEAFYSNGDHRTSVSEPERYQISLTYDNCSVEDCARNAFNNNDLGENTTVTGCRIRDVGGCAWEGSNRFVRFTGNYVRNAGPVAIGNLRSRDPEYERLGTAQHIVADNVFEDNVPYGRAAITVGAGASQVIIKGNIFVNMNSNGIRVVGTSQYSDLPSERVIISGNSMDMTAVYSAPKERYGICFDSSYVTVSDNHIYSRGTSPDNTFTAIKTSILSVGSMVHSNTLSGAGVGIEVSAPAGEVGTVVGNKSFYRREQAFGLPVTPPIPRRLSHRFKGWTLRWKKGGESTVAFCDPDSRLFTLVEPFELSEGDDFTLEPPSKTLAVRDNIITDCLDGLALDDRCLSKTAVTDNIIS